MATRYDPRPIDPPGTWDSPDEYDPRPEFMPSEREDRLEKTVEELALALRTAGDLLIDLGATEAGRIAKTLADEGERKL